MPARQARQSRRGRTASAQLLSERFVLALFFVAVDRRGHKITGMMSVRCHATQLLSNGR